MSFFSQMFQNKPLVAALIGWLVAQVIKSVLYAVINRDFRLERMVGSGGMPSSHAATVCALTTSVARQCGPGSTEFALACVLTLVVLYDARGVRFETGKQATTISAIVDLLESAMKVDLPNLELKELVGHTTLQVFAGSLLGIGIGLLFG